MGVCAPLFIPQAFTVHHSGPESLPCNQQRVFARTEIPALAELTSQWGPCLGMGLVKHWGEDLQAFPYFPLFPLGWGCKGQGREGED